MILNKYDEKILEIIFEQGNIDLETIKKKLKTKNLRGISAIELNYPPTRLGL